MITLLVDECYAFDYLSILHIKKELSEKSFDSWSLCESHIKSQIGDDLYSSIINSLEYENLVAANKKTFDMVDKAKEDKCTAKDVDMCNYERYLSKINLQNKFFETKISETKVGYEKYEFKSA